MTPQELKNSILQRAFTGKLVEHSYSKLEIKTVDIDEGPFEIPNHWGWQKFDKFCDMYTGNSIPVHVKKQKYEGLEEGYDYIGTKDVGFDQSINYNNGVRIPFETDFKIAKSGSVLMCIEGGSAGRKLGILDKDVCFGNKLCSFNSQKILNKYIFYYLQSPLFLKEFSSNMTGIIGGVSMKRLKSIYTPICPYDEQKRIVEKIEELMPLVEAYEENWKRLEELNKKFPEDMKKSLLQEAIKGKLVEQRSEEGSGEELYETIQVEKKKLIKEGKIKKQKALPEITEDEIPFEIPGSWKWVRLGEIMNFQGGYAFKSSSYVLKSKNQVIRLGNVKQNQLLTNIKQIYISNDLAKEVENYKIEQDDIIVTMTGTRRKKDYFYVTLITQDDISEKELYLNQRVGCFRLTKLVYNKYILKVLQSNPIRNIIFEKETGTANQGNIGSEDIKKNIYIPLPPLNEQKRIVERLEELLPLCEQLMTKAE